MSLLVRFVDWFVDVAPLPEWIEFGLSEWVHEQKKKQGVANKNNGRRTARK